MCEILKIGRSTDGGDVSEIICWV